MSVAKSASVNSRTILRLILLMLVLVGLFFALLWVKNSGLLARALEWISSLGPWGPFVFILIYIVVAVLLVPASILTFGAGVVFGMLYGSIYVLVAATAASTVAFIIGRHFARDRVERKLGDNPKFRLLDAAVAREGWKVVALVRLAPVFPFGLMSYGFGITRIPFWHYFWATFAMIPGTLMYIYFGTLAGDLAGLKNGIQSPTWMKGLIFVLAVVVTSYTARFASRALARRTP